MAERFKLLTEIGRGGMGVVWKARDEETGQIVALKLLRESYAEDPEYLARFERELELAKRIDSIHVVKVVGFGVRKRVPYLALEYIDGPSLHQALSSHGPYSWPDTRAMLIQLAQGLADANAAGVIHRDVKPSNVLIGPDGVAKLTDFGIARGLDTTRLTATSAMLGTPAYMAPEGPKDQRSDLYALGIIGYELLTGAAPFAGSTYQEMIVRHIRETPDLAKLPPDARNVVGWLLAKDPASRPQRASALLPVLYGAAQAPSPQELQRTVVAHDSMAPTIVAPGGRAHPAGSSPNAGAGPTPGQAGYLSGASSSAWTPTLTPRARSTSTPILAVLGGLALVLCVGVAVMASGAMQPHSSDPVATASEVAAMAIPSTQGSAAVPTLPSSTPAGPQPVTVAVNRQVTDRVGTIVTLTQMERLASGEIRLTFNLQYEGKSYKGQQSIQWAVNETEYLTLSSGATVRPLSWGAGSSTYRVGNADRITVGTSVVTTWELYPALADPHPIFTCHTDGRVFDGLTL